MFPVDSMGESVQGPTSLNCCSRKMVARKVEGHLVDRKPMVVVVVPRGSNWPIVEEKNCILDCCHTLVWAVVVGRANSMPVEVAVAENCPNRVDKHWVAWKSCLTNAVVVVVAEMKEAAVDDAWGNPMRLSMDAVQDPYCCRCSNYASRTVLMAH